MAATYQDPKDLIPLIPYIKHIHGKCWEMNKGNDFSDAQITYDTVVPVLMQNGFDGYIATEYEGQRSMEVSDVDEVNEVRRQHIMLKRLLGSIIILQLYLFLQFKRLSGKLFRQPFSYTYSHLYQKYQVNVQSKRPFLNLFLL